MIVADLDVFTGAVQFIIEERSLIAEKTWDHLLLSGTAMLVALALALPLGIWLGHLHRGSFVAINVANVGRALPSLALIAIGVAFLGVASSVATITSSTCSAVTVGIRPGRGSSLNPSSPESMNRARHLPTVAPAQPSCAATDLLSCP